MIIILVISARQGSSSVKMVRGYIMYRPRKEGEGHFGATNSALDNSAPCRFGAGNFGAVS